MTSVHNDVTPVGANFGSDKPDWLRDKMSRKNNKKAIKIRFQNRENLPKEPNNHKSKKLISYIVEKDFDIFGIAEIGLDWRKLNSNKQWKERIWDKSKCVRSIPGACNGFSE